MEVIINSKLDRNKKLKSITKSKKEKKSVACSMILFM